MYMYIYIYIDDTEYIEYIDTSPKKERPQGAVRWTPAP